MAESHDALSTTLPLLWISENPKGRQDASTQRLKQRHVQSVSFRQRQQGLEKKGGPQATKSRSCAPRSSKGTERCHHDRTSASSCDSRFIPSYQTPYDDASATWRQARLPSPTMSSLYIATDWDNHSIDSQEAQMLCEGTTLANRLDEEYWKFWHLEGWRDYDLETLIDLHFMVEPPCLQ